MEPSSGHDLQCDPVDKAAVQSERQAKREIHSRRERQLHCERIPDRTRQGGGRFAGIRCSNADANRLPIQSKQLDTYFRGKFKLTELGQEAG